ncbi:tRNA (adenosine(37)-N6)-threonylcarbamoyltransferase complex ATPase subunit type 1 TsaE [Anaerobranca gottschalkii]|uniref:tRNA threonylcarbamoyladenosine biosynthesis protein TsaE n=1 Tax=Anaerobranca gottschalkii DSM 13577 TaxID=1120990 RepID=A0A1I0C321_9FIRM|nr:tRNA (adenosine(37)-N6)-threonylcarbamoyltransferase complex ATPase subunit type 1 TsaE [Anaerobranca gottschalkii]SET13679.1 tRNA threonylcarbamoyladenosine biosynthesis protein TsaE [Anaerobranca gottschalkii DSM 13577]
MEFKTNSKAETMELGKKIGALLKSGDILILEGDLGAGKTTFTQGIAQGMGINDYVKSPTFTYVMEYRGKIPLYHFDLYRLKDPEELYDLGFEDFLYQGVLVMEWGSMVEKMLAEDGFDYIKISLLKTGENTRIIHIEDTPKGQGLYKELSL